MRPLARFAAVVTLAVAAPAVAKIPLRSSDYHPNPGFHPVTHGRGAQDMPVGAVEQVGEVVILEGDSTLVSDDGAGNYGIVFDNTTQQPPLITQRFFSQYPDQFDEVIVLTTFDDTGAQGALAYEISSISDVKGIGQDLFDDDPGQGGWGADQHGLHAFVNMMRWDQFKDMDGLDPTNPQSEFYSVLGQEFAHRWLSFMRYKSRATGKASMAMLGRDQAHWASTLQADASVMDGNKWVDNGDGTFTDVETFDKYSALDLYGMGLVGKEDVPPWYLIDGAVNLSTGSKVDPTRYLRLGTKVSGTREDISIDDVVAAEGDRSPSWMDSSHEFRVAFVLVTRPGEHASDVLDAARTLDKMRVVWEQAFAQYTGGHGKMCTQVSAPCGSPTAKIIAGTVVENGGNHNGIVEPGEPVQVKFTLANDGPAAATSVSVVADSDLVTVAATPQVVASLAPGQSTDVVFDAKMPPGAMCGDLVTVHAKATTDAGTFRGFAQVVPGLTTLFSDDFEDSSDKFTANQAGTDTATANGWQYGTPVAYYSQHGYVYQPGAGHSGTKCWFTGLEQGHHMTATAPIDSGVGVGTTTLWSPAWDLSTTYKPVLRYWAWFEAIDYSSPGVGGEISTAANLTVEGSVDGGKSWQPVDVVDGAEPDWRYREIPLDAFAGAKQLQLRFTTSAPDGTTLVEAGLDDVAVATLTETCNPDPPRPAPDGCGCRVGAAPRAPLGPALATLALLAVALVTRRRARPAR